MSGKHSPFDIQRHDLGDNKSGIDRLGVDQLFSTADLYDNAKCSICSNVPAYKLVPKHKHLQTAYMEDKGYVCNHCVQMQYISPNDYKLKEL